MRCSWRETELRRSTLFRESAPDLVITDLFMPRMDGIELTRAIRQIGDTPIIILSVREQETMKVAALDEGADDYVTKPFSMQELLARVRAQLRKSARQPRKQRRFPSAILKLIRNSTACASASRRYT